MNFLNKKNISIMVSLVLVAGVGVYFIQQSNEKKEQSAKSALYQVDKSLDAEIALLTEVEKASGSKIDVDVKLPKTVAELNKIVSDQSLTAQVLFEAAMKLGNLYSDHPTEHSFERAIAAYKKAISFAKTDFQKSTACYLAGMAFEQQGMLKESEEQFKTGLAVGYEGMKGEMMLAMVRVNVKTKNTTQAKAFADKLNKEQPGTRAAQEAQKLISKS